MSDDAQKVTDALRDSRLPWGTHSDRWADSAWQDEFWREVAGTVLAALDLPARDALARAEALREAASALPGLDSIRTHGDAARWLRDRANAIDSKEGQDHG